jgi:hypothetical protein
MTTTTVTTVRFGRTSTRGLMLGFSTSRVIALAAAITVLVIGLFTAGGFGAMVASIIWIPLASSAFVRVAGRPAIEWAPVALGFGTRHQTKQTEYRTQLPIKPRPAGTLALPGDAAALRFHVDETTGAAMIHDPHRQTLTAVLSVSHQAFVLLDADERNQRVAHWGRLYAALAQSGTCAALQVLEATIPDPARGQIEWYAEHGVNDGSLVDTEYRELLSMGQLAAGTHRTTISLSLNMKSTAKAIKAAGRGMTGAANVLRGDMASLSDGLRQASLRVGHWLTEPELAAIIRGAYDPAAILDPRSDPGANLDHAGPMAISEHWEYLRHDGAYSAVLWISEWPRIEVQGNFLHALIFAPNIRRTFSLVAHPLPTDAALRQIRKEKTEAITDSAQKAKVGQLADLSDAQEYADLLARERSVVAGHTDVEFSGFVTVTAPTMEALDSAKQLIIRAASSAACEVRPVYGHQLQSFVLAALPLARKGF